jgi:hypothetical protein
MNVRKVFSVKGSCILRIFGTFYPIIRMILPDNAVANRRNRLPPARELESGSFIGWKRVVMNLAESLRGMAQDTKPGLAKRLSD